MKRSLFGRGTMMLAVGVFALGLLMGLVGTSAAGTSFSSYGYYTTAGNNYKNRSYIYTDHDNNHSAHASTASIYRDGGNIGAGWMGALPRRFNGNGVLLCTGVWYYNGGPASSITVNGCYINSHAGFGSDGQTRAWHGSGYYTYGAFSTLIMYS